MGNSNLEELMRAKTQLNRLVQYINNKKIGYEPKCKICNSKYQNEVERSREKGHTLEEIKEFLDEKGENVSIMSISRHFDRHYPARRTYLKELDEEKANTILEGEKTIEQDLKYDPEFKEELDFKYEFCDYDKPIYDDDGNCIDFENYYKTGRDIYIFDHGYCYTGDKFCELVPRLQRYEGNDVTYHLELEISKINDGGIKDFTGEKKIKLLEDSLKCTQCQVLHNEWITEALLNLFLKEIYGMEMNPDKFKKILWDVDFINEELDKELRKYAAKNE